MNTRDLRLFSAACWLKLTLHYCAQAPVTWPQVVSPAPALSFTFSNLRLHRAPHSHSRVKAAVPGTWAVLGQLSGRTSGWAAPDSQPPKTSAAGLLFQFAQFIVSRCWSLQPQILSKSGTWRDSPSRVSQGTVRINSMLSSSYPEPGCGQ